MQWQPTRRQQQRRPSQVFLFNTNGNEESNSGKRNRRRIPNGDDPNNKMDYFTGESEDDDDNFNHETDHDDDDDDEEEDEEYFLRKELAHLEALEEILAELDEAMGDVGDDDDDDDINNFYDEHAHGDEDEDWAMWTKDSLSELFSTLEEEDDEEESTQAETPLETTSQSSSSSTQKMSTKPSDTTLKTSSTTSPPAASLPSSSLANLEQALSQGVVPVSAGVGTDCLPGDFGFDPLQLADKDYFYQIQSTLLRLLPASSSSTTSKTATTTTPSTTRPRALILRDYREAEIRHSRLAMLAAIVWPLQEMLDKFLLPDQLFGPLVYGPVTLPYFPLAMTLILLLLGYLDIYSQAIKDMDQIGDAYLPGDCFWDPLNVLPPADATTNGSDANANLDGMKRRMQERELFNGRAAMMAVLAYTWEEVVTHQAIIDLPGNKVLFTPIYQLPMVQEWLDSVFSDTIR